MFISSSTRKHIVAHLLMRGLLDSTANFCRIRSTRADIWLPPIIITFKNFLFFYLTGKVLLINVLILIWGKNILWHKHYVYPRAVIFLKIWLKFVNIYYTLRHFTSPHSFLMTMHQLWGLKPWYIFRIPWYVIWILSTTFIGPFRSTIRHIPLLLQLLLWLSFLHSSVWIYFKLRISHRKIIKLLFKLLC